MADYKSMRSACAEAKGGRIAERAGVRPHAAVPHARTGTNHKHHSKPQGYADGGAVEGGKPKARHDRKPHGKVAVNVIVAPQGQPQARPVPVPVPAPRPPMGGAPGLGAPPGGMPPRPMPGGPPGAGAMPPPGMRPPGMKDGGALKMTAGAASGEGRLQKGRAAKRDYEDKSELVA